LLEKKEGIFRKWAFWVISYSSLELP
jgi:hypothetical protein